ncbi:DUF5807 family protein [Halobellus limi]|jgi:hypothetical protein|uniref:Uncharacterized protein n=1 Tax=Halobellus limi TaxID=699433 RepID=A0A1H6CMQ8_9EURY|nr:DUF5807 family protein [Halobellus limi]QCC48757.1 hypothetical protein DV707_14455 [Halobellus limi]SEG73756.1 hypothetical protein SAMN04488133_3529 [Halobellus limi]
MSQLDAFLAGERHDDVALFLTEEYLDSQGKLPKMGETVDSGYVLVVPGDDGRRAFAAGTGMDAMEFARGAMESRGHISRSLDGGECPEAETAGSGDDATDADSEDDVADGDHDVEFIFAFSEAQNEEVGGLYARGAVVHAYAHCACGASYSDKWVVGAEDETGVQPGESEPAEGAE